MADKCPIDGRKLSFFNKVEVKDGTICAQCRNKIGLNPSVKGYEVICKAYTVNEIKDLIDNGKQYDPSVYKTQLEEISKQQVADLKQIDSEHPKGDNQQADQKSEEQALSDLIASLKSNYNMDFSEAFWYPNIANQFVKIIQQNIPSNGIKVLVALKGAFGEYLVATTDRVYIFKKGFMTGHIIGSGTFSASYKQITNIIYDFHMMSGTFSIATAGTDFSKKDYWSNGSDSASQAPNVISLIAAIKDDFKQAASILLQYKDEKESSPATTDTESTTQDPYDQIRQLKGLLDDGIITQADFDAKKKQLLGL